MYCLLLASWDRHKQLKCTSACSDFWNWRKIDNPWLETNHFDFSWGNSIVTIWRIITEMFILYCMWYKVKIGLSTPFVNEKSRRASAWTPGSPLKQLSSFPNLPLIDDIVVKSPIVIEPIFDSAKFDKSLNLHESNLGLGRPLIVNVSELCDFLPRGESQPDS